jgi:NitT/TauT family transport system permease protein
LLIRQWPASAEYFLTISRLEALPFIFAGLNIGLVLSVLGAIVGEFVGAKVGLGYLILQMNFNLDVAGMFAVLVVLGLTGAGFNMAAQYLRRKIVFWQPEGITEAAK